MSSILMTAIIILALMAVYHFIGPGFVALFNVLMDTVNIASRGPSDKDIR